MKHCFENTFFCFDEFSKTICYKPTHFLGKILYKFKHKFLKLMLSLKILLIWLKQNVFKFRLNLLFKKEVGAL